MYKILKSTLLLLLFFTIVLADSQTEIQLKPGNNEIAFKVLNNSELNFESIYVEIKNEDLPVGFVIKQNSAKMNIASKSKNQEGLQINIEVNEKAKPGVYEIPFFIKDKADHSWSYSLTANLISTKPDKYDLTQNYPNPFNAFTKINYSLIDDKNQETRLIIVDLLGRHIKTLVNENQAAGSYNVFWDGRDEQGNEVASGIYFYKLTSGSFLKIRKMSMLK
ncbi:T9SS type A sorting domain-containing protein [candidate division KSB1 bacterium]|nr:T9SS type A sorting domain-containing protein [candidate division KSB1 bacterium]